MKVKSLSHVQLFATSMDCIVKVNVKSLSHVLLFATSMDCIVKVNVKSLSHVLLFATSMDCIVHTYKYMASQVTLVVKKLPANADGGDMGSIPGSGRSPGVGDGTPLQYSPLENPMDRRAWWATVHGAARSWTRLSD